MLLLISGEEEEIQWKFDMQTTDRCGPYTVIFKGI